MPSVPRVWPVHSLSDNRFSIPIRGAVLGARQTSGSRS